MSDGTLAERQAIDPVFKQLVEAEFMAYQATCPFCYGLG